MIIGTAGNIAKTMNIQDYTDEILDNEFERYLPDQYSGKETQSIFTTYQTKGETR